MEPQETASLPRSAAGGESGHRALARGAGRVAVDSAPRLVYFCNLNVRSKRMAVRLALQSSFGQTASAWRVVVKGKRTALDTADCAIARSLDVIGDWWSILIIRDALAGKRRFGEFQQGLGLAKNILSARLKKLVDCGVLAMIPASDGSSYREYVLTEKGQRLYVVIVALWQWGEEFCFADGGPGYDIVDRQTRTKVAPLQLMAQDGRTIGPRDLARRDLGPPSRGDHTAKPGS